MDRWFGLLSCYFYFSLKNLDGGVSDVRYLYDHLCFMFIETKERWSEVEMGRSGLEDCLLLYLRILEREILCPQYSSAGLIVESIALYYILVSEAWRVATRQMVLSTRQGTMATIGKPNQHHRDSATFANRKLFLNTFIIRECMKVLVSASSVVGWAERSPSFAGGRPEALSLGGQRAWWGFGGLCDVTDFCESSR